MTAKESIMEKNLKVGRNETGDRRKFKKLKQLRKKRLIVRNLSFKVGEEELKQIFSEFGEVLEVQIPLKEDGRKRGFAFVQFQDSRSQMKAMKAMNFKEIAGRRIALDFAVDKTTYQSQRKAAAPLAEPASQPEESKPVVTRVKVEKEENPVTEFLKEFGTDEEASEQESGSDSDESVTESKNLPDERVNKRKHSEDVSEGSGSDESQDESVTESKNLPDERVTKRKHSEDVSEGRTVFIRNVSYQNTKEDLQEVMEEYGETEYCLLCTDPLTDHPKGTAFVKFKLKQSAHKLIQESEKEPGVIVDGRRLLCTSAVSRQEVMKTDSPEHRDRRNLRLLKCSLIMHGSKEAEGVSQADMAKRAQLEMVKKTKLKNVNFFVSDKRLAVHNLPKNITDADLRALFKKAAGKEAVIKEARVMRDLTRTDSRGSPVSRGFGFVSFTEHKDALNALTQLNNNPRIFTPATRPIVEFSVENKMALLSQQRKHEKLKMMNKKRMEAKLQAEEADDRQPNASLSNWKQKKMEAKHFQAEKRKQREHLEKKTKKKQKNRAKHQKPKASVMNVQEKKFVSGLTDKYKSKLMDKLA